VFELPENVVASITDVVQPVVVRSANDPFYASRPDVAGRARPLDTTPFIDTAVPLTNTEAGPVDRPIHPRRIVMMKKRG